MGPYALTVAAPGYRMASVAKFDLESDQVARYDIPLAVGSSSDTVTVTALAPILDTQDATGFGTSSYGSTVRDPGYHNFDASAGKDVAMSRGLVLGFRADAYNVLNGVSWAAMNDSISNSSFGSITSTGTSTTEHHTSDRNRTRLHRSRTASHLRNLKVHDLRLHMDGARFANACASLCCSPAELTWKSGIDVLCVGGTKKGMAVGEVILFFDRKLAIDFDYRCKQAGQLASKMRFLAAPWVGMLEG